MKEADTDITKMIEEIANSVWSRLDDRRADIKIIINSELSDALKRERAERSGDEYVYSNLYNRVLNNDKDIVYEGPYGFRITVSSSNSEEAKLRRRVGRAISYIISGESF